MAFTLAVAGKGGTGKTTIAALLVSLLLKHGKQPVLAVDADPNPNLDIALGATLSKTIGELREDLLDQIRKMPPGMTKDDYLEMGIQECLSEGQGVDLLAMGCGEGPRCYCAVNSVLRRCIDRLRGSYPYMVIDNEAGLEHLSRSTTQNVDVLIIVSTASPAALKGAARILKLSHQLSLGISRRFLVLNNSTDCDPGQLRSYCEGMGLEVGGIIPYDRQFVELGLAGRPVSDLVNGSPGKQAVEEILGKVLTA
ncbi:MAG: carbon monoxide dehydrogenase [Acidobacteria bacterium]|nr:MAG: carbon monoxide dehydrogenase [Acidobacteriota bacterium]